VYRVCQAYAALDLAELAPLCVAADYQERFTPWPIVMPEDIGRVTS
jgi:hypothetical protein